MTTEHAGCIRTCRGIANYSEALARMRAFDRDVTGFVGEPHYPNLTCAYHSVAIPRRVHSYDGVAAIPVGYTEYSCCTRPEYPETVTFGRVIPGQCCISGFIGYAKHPCVPLATNPGTGTSTIYTENSRAGPIPIAAHPGAPRAIPAWVGGDTPDPYALANAGNAVHADRPLTADTMT